MNMVLIPSFDFKVVVETAAGAGSAFSLDWTDAGLRGAAALGAALAAILFTFFADTGLAFAAEAAGAALMAAGLRAGTGLAAVVEGATGAGAASVFAVDAGASARAVVPVVEASVVLVSSAISIT
ncbi:hypothetical protein [Sphingosinicella sp. BN140058]|uniref:hypothetical protein n=1 Tax=Sphingosinicella sp. BN140058 TaxID=1892855 RepID=UPI0013EA16B6|nr:hypothetical protein [Sphingosinicella sp. BN140058]